MSNRFTTITHGFDVLLVVSEKMNFKKDRAPEFFPAKVNWGSCSISQVSQLRPHQLDVGLISSKMRC